MSTGRERSFQAYGAIEVRGHPSTISPVAARMEHRNLSQAAINPNRIGTIRNTTTPKSRIPANGLQQPAPHPKKKEQRTPPLQP
jgi:hypothetical protein